jgi:hypothetical protein
MLDTYDPSTYQKSTHDHHSQKSTEIQPLIQDEYLSQRLNRAKDRFIYTFFNDELIGKLSHKEQAFHKQMLKKFIILYHSMGVGVHICHSKDSISNSNWKEFKETNNNHLKLLALQEKMNANEDTFAFYSDYTLFPMNGDWLQKLRYNQFTLSSDYEFEVMLTDKNGLERLMQSLLHNTRDLQIMETNELNGIFADYSLETWRKLMNTNDLGMVLEQIPRALNGHLRHWRLGQYDTIAIVDPITLNDHYFSRPMLQTIKSVLQCESSMYPPPLKSFVKKFENDILPELGLRTNVDSMELREQNSRKLKDLMRPYVVGCNDHLRIEVSSELDDGSKTLNMVSIPHPLSIASAMHLTDKHIITNAELISSKHDLLDQLLQLDKVSNSILFNSEFITIQNFIESLELFLGFEMKPINDPQGFQFNDLSKAFKDIIGQQFALSENEFKDKMDSAKKLVVKYEEPLPYVINQRQTEEKLQQYRDDLKKDKAKGADLEQKVLKTQMFESRHDPIVDIAEIWNPRDTGLWWLVKNLRYVDQEIIKALAW